MPRRNFRQPGPVHLDKKGEKWARESLKKMSLEQKIGQMFMIWARAQFMNVDSPEYIGLRDTMRKYHIGGFGLTVQLRGRLALQERAAGSRDADQSAAKGFGVSSDLRAPTSSAGWAFASNDVTSFPHAMAFGATGDVEFARESARITAQEARAIGVQWNWFPDADVNSNPLNPIINTRSFGEDPKQVSDMVVAYIEGAHQYGMLTTAKHFPGHGDTDIDSHLAVPSVKGDKAHLESVELPPFHAAIKAGVDAVMVAHVAVPALDPDPDHVATISPAIVTGLLKQQMGFKGLVVTDALTMAGLTKLFPEGGSAGAGRAAVEAVKAGNDMLLIPVRSRRLLQRTAAGGAQRRDSGVAHRRVGAEDPARQGLGRTEPGDAGRHRCGQPHRGQAGQPGIRPRRSPTRRSPWCATIIRCCR